MALNIKPMLAVCAACTITVCVASVAPEHSTCSSSAAVRSPGDASSGARETMFFQTQKSPVAANADLSRHTGSIGRRDADMSAQHSQPALLSEDEVVGATPIKKHPSKYASCKGAQFREMCRQGSDAFAEELEARAAQRGPSERPSVGDASELLQTMEWNLPYLLGHGRFENQTIGEDAVNAFSLLRKLEAWEVLAFRETWTDADTELLRSVDPNAGGFTSGMLTTDAFAARLPSISDLQALISQGSVAIVGSGPTLRGHGQEIDKHPVVVRFNFLVQGKLDANDTGLKTDVHVMNNYIKPPQDKEPGVVQFDLDGTYPWLSYCKRMHLQGECFDPKHEGMLYMIRPSAFCGLKGLTGFSRGFLFYWLVGSLFEKADIYGMGREDGELHYDHSEIRVGEEFLSFEHFLYKSVKQMLADKQEKVLEDRLRARMQAQAEDEDNEGNTPL